MTRLIYSSVAEGVAFEGSGTDKTDGMGQGSQALKWEQIRKRGKFEERLNTLGQTRVEGKVRWLFI